MRGNVIRTLLMCALPVAAVLAQQTVAPTPAPSGPVRGVNAGEYNVLGSFEAGWRFRTLNGDEGKYRSDVNYGNGLRLLSSSLRVNSRNGQGSYFDELSLQTQGLGNDPYQFSSLRIEKNNLYRYDLTWRLQDYYNPALPLARGLHFMNTERRFQDHDLTVTLHPAVRLFGGYSRNAQDGPALSTLVLADVVPLFTDVRRLNNEYRLGGEARFFGARLTVLRGWSEFSEHTRFGATAVSRVEPYRGSSPYWRANLQREGRLWAATARYSYAIARRNFFFDEAASASRFGSRQTAVAGSGERPVSTGSLALSLFPAETVTVTNTTSFYNTRMSGDNRLLEVIEGVENASVAFQLLGIRTIANATDATFRVKPWAALYGGYHFSNRRIRSVQSPAFSGEQPEDPRFEHENTLHSGLAGVRLQLAKPLTLNFDAELGRADHPVFPISEANYHLLGARVQYRARTLTLSAAARANYNANSVSLAEHSSRGRVWSADASWTPRGWFGLDASYSKLHLDTLTGLQYFAAGALLRDRSVYISEIHSTTFTARFGIGQRADFWAGYSRIQDTADPRGGAQLPAFVRAQAFPLVYDTPLARIAVRLRESVRLNAGWQFYRYSEKWFPADGFDPRRYNAHTGYTSLSWTF
ncbi:MAG TPA: hypothetical protein VN428_12400 [Bryobacteraceae bacterium]|nr:hypothetical protein [Bryobacteraceae bacterium]